MKTIKLKCLDNGKVEVSHGLLFQGETINIHVDYIVGIESFIKYLDLKIGTSKENAAQNSLSMDYVVRAQAGTLEIQPYATELNKFMKWETVKVPIKTSIQTL